MAFFLIEKGDREQEPVLEIELPPIQKTGNS